MYDGLVLLGCYTTLLGDWSPMLWGRWYSYLRGFNVNFVFVGCFFFLHVWQLYCDLFFFLSTDMTIFMWCVQVLRSPNFFLGEWKQIETWKLLEERWLFFRLGEAKWQHCTTRWMPVMRSSCSSVFDTEMATFTFEEQRVIIRFLHLRGKKPIEIHRQLSETCSDGVMDVKNVRSWMRHFKEGRTSCDVVRSSCKVT